MPQSERIVVGGWFEDSRGPQRDLRFVAAPAEREGGQDGR